MSLHDAKGLDLRPFAGFCARPVVPWRYLLLNPGRVHAPLDLHGFDSELPRGGCARPRGLLGRGHGDDAQRPQLPLDSGDSNWTSPARTGLRLAPASGRLARAPVRRAAWLEPRQLRQGQQPSPVSRDRQLAQRPRRRRDPASSPGDAPQGDPRGPQRQPRRVAADLLRGTSGLDPRELPRERRWSSERERGVGRGHGRDPQRSERTWDPAPSSGDRQPRTGLRLPPR